MKRVLIINHSDPFAKGGGSYASHAYVKAFAEWADGNIDVCIPAESKYQIDESIRANSYISVPRRSQFERILSVLTGDIQRYTSFLKKHLRENPDTYGLAIFSGSFEGGALVDMCHQYGLKVITIHHNYDSEYAYDNISTPVYRELFVKHVYALQRKAYQKSDYNFFLTKDDICRCEKEFGKTDEKNKLIGVFEFADIPPLQGINKKSRELTFVITGQLNNVQGVDSINYFFRDLYKFLPSDCKVIISGRNPSRQIVALCSRYDNVELIPNPEIMADVISSGDIYICPVRVGGGVKLRIMDGLKLGLPIITHKCSARGYDAFDDTPYFKSFDAQEGFNEAITKFKEMYDRGEINKNEVYNKYLNSFSFESGLSRLKQILSRDTLL